MQKTAIKIFIVLIITIINLKSYGQKIVGDCTIVFGLETADKSLDANILNNASKTFYLRGRMSLTEIKFDNFKQTTIYTQNGDKAYILYDLNNEKYMTVLSNEEFKNQYVKYKNLIFKDLSETKNILGYNCTKAIGTLKDGTKINIYYTSEIKTTVTENPYEFDNVNGLVLAYDAIVKQKYKVSFVAKRINFNPVPAEKFIVPKEGYRILSPNDK